MHLSAKLTTSFASPPSAPASTNYPFLAKPPKRKHKPQPIIVRCVPPRSLPRPASSRRRVSGSGSPASFPALVDTPTPISDTPHLTSHGYTAAFSTLNQRRGSIPDTPHPTRPSPNSPKRGVAPRSAPSSPKRSPGSGSPKRRHHRPPSSPFAPPSPTQLQTRVRAKSTTRPALPVPVPAPRTPKLSKIRSLTNMRPRPPPAPPVRTTSPPMTSSSSGTLKQIPKRSKRSATPARGSAAYSKYRPMPFIQQMQMIQLLEGGSLDSHIRRHHVHAGQGIAHTGFAIDQELHGYSFTDESGMIWFDEEEEWEFASLLPRAQPRRKRGIRRLLSRRRDEESEEEWEDFAGADECGEDDIDTDVLLARKVYEPWADEDDLAAFGGALDGAWGRDRPECSVLKLPSAKHECKSQRRRARRGALSVPPIASASASGSAPTTVLKQEFLSTAFCFSSARTPPAAAVPVPPARATSPFHMFTYHRPSRSVSNTNTDGGPSFASFGATLHDGIVVDANTSLALQGATLALAHETTKCQPSPANVQLRSVSPPPAAARRLGIDPATIVSLQPSPVKKPSFMNFHRRRN